MALGELVKAYWNGNMALENSPVGESQSNGMVERAIQTWEGQVRTMKDALETRIGMEIPPDHPLLTWLIQHAAALQRRCTVGEDGKTHNRGSREDRAPDLLPSSENESGIALFM